MKKRHDLISYFSREVHGQKGFCPETYMALSFMIDKKFPHRLTADKQKILNYARKTYSGADGWSEEVFNKCWDKYRRYLESI